MTAINTTIDRLDWASIGSQLDAEGYAVLPGLLGADAARELAQRMRPAKDAKGEPLHAADLGGADSLYFGTTLPAPLDAWRTALYGHLAAIANRWSETLGIAARYPATLEDFQRRNQKAGQTRGQSYLSRLVMGDHVPLHQRNDGEQVLTQSNPKQPGRADVVPLRQGEVDRLTRAYLQHPHPAKAHAARMVIDRSVPVGERLQALWRPWTDYVIVPLFALANAGVVLSADALGAAAASPVTLGAIAGLVLGKPLGILFGCALAVGFKLGDLPPGVTRLQLAGRVPLTGIGFTISLPIAEISVPDRALADQARVGILAASLLTALAGFALLRLAARRSERQARTGCLPRGGLETGGVKDAGGEAARVPSGDDPEVLGGQRPTSGGRVRLESRHGGVGAKRTAYRHRLFGSARGLLRKQVVGGGAVGESNAATRWR